MTSSNEVRPGKLLHSKWTAVQPVGKDRHFMVTKVPAVLVGPGADDWVEIEPVMSRIARRIPWRELEDTTRWQQGWVRGESTTPR